MGCMRKALTAAIGCLGWAALAHAEISDKVVKIGVLTDLTSVYSEVTGAGSVIAARMAAEDFKKKAGSVATDFTVEILAGDHQNKPDIGSALTRRWLDIDHVDAVVDVPNSAVALGVNEILRGTKAVFLASTPATPELTGKACSPNTVQWLLDTWSLANSTVRAVMKNGGTSWYFISSDYTLGQSLEQDAFAVIKAAGGSVLGSVRHPINASDFSSFLLQAQSSGAKVIGLANAGGDTLTAIKQAHEFMIGSGSQVLATFLLFVNDVHALGLETAQGLLFTEAFYWDLTDGTRDFSQRFARLNNGKMPSSNQAGVYSAVLAYLNAVAAAGSDDAARAMAEMKRAPIQDPLFGEVTVRADGRAIHPMHLFRVKTPSQSKKPWDYYDLVHTIPAAEAFRPLLPARCSLVEKQ